jgi:small nuclear ribonucleoprotein (snRNP)-like protein
LSISSVKLNANRVVIGTLRGFDQFMNLVVDNTVEVNGNDKTDIGMVVSFLLLKVIWNFFHVYLSSSFK